MTMPDAVAEHPAYAVRAAGLSAAWDRGSPALVDVSLTLSGGGTIVVHGGPATGKSTLLHVLRAAMPPSAGELRLLGSDPWALPARVRWALKRRIGYIAQTPRLFEHASAFDNVAAPLQLAGVRRDPQADADVSELLNYLGLSESAAVPASALSDTQRRLVAVARAVVGRPDIVCADEPLAGLGADAMARVLRLLAELARQRAALVIATQAPETYAALAASRRFMDRGRLAP